MACCLLLTRNEKRDAIKMGNFANGAYSITLPAGKYELVASTAAETVLLLEDLKEDTELDIVFGL